MEQTISTQHPVAYFCAEYGLEDNLPLYAGGLGILAGDTLKQAADNKLPLVAIGLLYRGYRARQSVDSEGKQVLLDDLYDPLSRGLEHVYIDDQPLFIKVHLSEVDVWLRVWKKDISETVTLYLLDSETDQNFMTERSLTQELYSGSNESQIKQQIILGVGGVKLLTALGVQPSVYHLNEGRPAFLVWQVIRQLMDHHRIDFDSALSHAKQKIVYTNHTLVAAGNKSYPVDQLQTLASYYAQKMAITVEKLLALGFEGSDFSITRFALNVSRKANGVSALHSQLSKEAWPEYHWESITNGVHMPTWQDARLAQAVAKEEIWQRHLELKQELKTYLFHKTGYQINEDALIVTWARRMAGYKQASALFNEVERLKKLCQDTDKPLYILVAGKAHHGDLAGSETIQSIITVMKEHLAGQALYVPDYSITTAQMLVKGSDLWLNTPELGKEACGTSGMKALSNGVLQCTVADGWAAEVEWPLYGWQLDHQQIETSIFDTLKKEIVPMYFQRKDGLPIQWLEKMQQSISLAKQFSTARMLEEYQKILYT